MFKRTISLMLFAASLLLTTSCEKERQANENKPHNKTEEIAEKERKATESRQERIKKEAAEIEKRIQDNPAIAQLIPKHNAIPYWGKDVEHLRQVLAINVQESLVRNDKRPVLLIAKIDDVAKEGDKYILTVESITYLADIYFALESNLEQVTKITNQDSSSHDEYAIIADVTSVRKLRFSISASPKSEDEAEIELDTSDAFTANGRCLDLLNIGHKDKE